MTHRCVGCGGLLSAEAINTGGVFMFGSAALIDGGNRVMADHTKTLCPTCKDVVKHYILNNDLGAPEFTSKVE